ncbi:MAG: hypothetical protein CBC13_04695 [Planctomycetia bacterium TMED53]|nr:MAG: hypothetical protein CBC13_04695 [Planctomycetia bacterium TMED53]
MSKIERVFLGKSQPILGEIADRLLGLATRPSAGGPLDLRDYLVILPGRRACRLLLRELSTRCHSSSQSLIPPQIETPGQIASILAEGPLPFVSPAEERLSWLLTLQQATSTEREYLGLDEEIHTSSTGLLKLSQVFARSIRQLKQEGSNPGAAAHLLSQRDTDAALRLRALEDLENRRLDLLRSWGVQPLEFQQTQPKDPHQKVILITIPELAAETRHWLEANCHCEVWIDSDPSYADRYDEWGRPIPIMWQEVLMPESIPLLVADQPRDLSLAVIDQICRNSAIKNVSDVSLGILDEDQIPTLEEGLRRQKLKLHLASGKPYSQGSTGRLLDGIRQAVSSDSFSSYSALVRHPDVFNRLPLNTSTKKKKLGILGEIDHWSTQRQPTLAEDPSAPGTVTYLREQFQPMNREDIQLDQRVDQFLEVLVNLLGADETGLPLLPEGEDEILFDTLEKLRECGLDSSIAISAESFAGLVCALTEDTPIAEKAEPLSIEGLGWLELPLDNTPNLILTGINEGKLSGSLNADPFIPESLRRELNIPGYEERVARDTHLLFNLLDGRKDVVLAISARDSQGNPQLPSRLLLRGDSGVDRLKHFLDPQKRIRLMEPSSPPSEDTVELGPPKWIDTPTPEKISVTGFSRWILDPVLYQLERQLGYSESHDRERQLNPMAFGNMIHWVLEKYGDSEKYRDLKEAEEILEAANQLLEKYRKTKLAKHPRAAVLVQIEQARARLEIWSQEQAKLRFQGWRIMATEIQLNPQTCKLKVDGSELGVSGRIDRVDYHPEKRKWRILDYKTSEQGVSPEKDHGRSAGKQQDWKKLQLPLYRHFASSLLIEGKSLPDDVEVGYFLLPGKTSVNSLQIAKWTEEDYTDAIEVAHEIAAELLSPEEWVLQTLSAPWDRAFAGVVIDAESSLSALDDETGEGSER